VTPTGDRDGVPNVLIEAMARGTPVVATAVSGLVDLLGERAVLIEPESPAAMARGLTDMLADRAQQANLAAAGRTHVKECYTTELNYQLLRDRVLGVLAAPRD
jgi:colanic acid/amylovoran biosynthesis glycosyltransferase